jgi:hypothetical protein
VGDYVLRLYPTAKAGQGRQCKVAPYWQGTFQIDRVWDANTYQIENFVNCKTYRANVNLLKTFHFDKDKVNPLGVAAKDVDDIVKGIKMTVKVTSSA